MEGSLAFLRLWCVLLMSLALTTTLFARQVGASVAKGAADAAATAISDQVSQSWDCRQTGLPANAQALAAQIASQRAAQLAAANVVDLQLRTDQTCSIVVAVTVESRGWLSTQTSVGIGCSRTSGVFGLLLRTPVAPPC